MPVNVAVLCSFPTAEPEPLFSVDTPNGFLYLPTMKTPTLPRCPELSGHLNIVSGSKPHFHVKVNDEGGELFFMPMVTYRDPCGERRTTLVADDCSDLPDFSTDGTGERQCFVWGYANIEDALTVVRALNRHQEE